MRLSAILSLMRLATITPTGTIGLSEEELQGLGVEIGEQVIIDVKAGVLTIVPLLEIDAKTGEK